MKLLKIGLVLFFLSFSCVTRADDPEKVVRVAVITDAKLIKLSIRAPYRILALNTSQELAQGRHLWQAQVVPTAGGIKIDKQDFKIYGVRIQPTRSPAIYLNDRRFRGAVDIVRQADGSLAAVNHLDVEEYIQGVLYHEVAPWWPMEALKAQAIVARTFALYQGKVNRAKDYDLVSTVYSQVYGGKTSERGRTSKAVRLTKNQVLTYQNKIFPTFYHATCAGHTEDSSRLWKIKIPPLRGRACQFCQRSPHLHWKRKIAFGDIEQALQKANYKVGKIDSIRIIDRDVSSRVIELEIISTLGTAKINANRFRLAVGANIVKSTNFDLEIKEIKIPFQYEKHRYAYFSGSGWGHGVGMCQWGSFFMARQRFNVEQILDYYYPESKIKEIQEIRNASGEFETF